MYKLRQFSVCLHCFFMLDFFNQYIISFLNKYGALEKYCPLLLTLVCKNVSLAAVLNFKHHNGKKCFHFLVLSKSM